jgi:hypothetical protein
LIVVELKGGLGNQLFQYASAKALSLEHTSPLKLDLSFLNKTANIISDNFTARNYELDIFSNLDALFVTPEELRKFQENSLWNRIKKKIGMPFFKTFEEPSFSYSRKIFDKHPPVLLKGYFTSEKYFKKYQQDIRACFKFPTLENDPTNFVLLDKIRGHSSVSVHVRRGDYLKSKMLEYHGVCDENYYTNAISLIRNKFPGSYLYIFSDDEEWANKNLVEKHPDTFLVSGNKGKASWKDMFLMSSCEHNIIANSTFSWWGAWLNNSPEKTVIAPKDWFKTRELNTSTLLPEEWIKI